MLRMGIRGTRVGAEQPLRERGSSSGFAGRLAWIADAESPRGSALTAR